MATTSQLRYSDAHGRPPVPAYPVWPWVQAGVRVLVAAMVFFAGMVFAIPYNLPQLYGRVVSGSSSRKALMDAYAAVFRESFAGLRYDREVGIREQPSDATEACEWAQFEGEVVRFSERISALANDPEKMRAEIVRLSQFKVYLRHKNGSHPAVLFLRRCGMRLESIPGALTFAHYGQTRIEKYLSSNQREISFSEFATSLGKAQKEICSHRDTILGTVVWGIEHLRKAAHVEYAHLNPLDYDSYQNHTVFHSEPLRDNGHVILHKYTPGLTGPRSIVKNVLIPAYSKRNLRWVHIDNQSTHEFNERQRVDEVHRWAQENPGVFLHAVIATDTPLKIAQAEVDQFVNTDWDLADFIQAYELKIRGTHNQFIRNYEEMRGIHIPNELLDDAELEAAFTAARNVILKSPENLELIRHPEGRRKLAKIISQNLNSVLSWAIMKKEQLHYKRSTFTQNCKEGLDRGPSGNLDMVLNDHLALGKTQLSLQTAYRGAGIALGRPVYTMDRAPLARRLNAFIDRTQFIDSSDEAREVAQAQLQRLRAFLIHPGETPPQEEPSYRASSCSLL